MHEHGETVIKWFLKWGNHSCSEEYYNKMMMQERVFIFQILSEKYILIVNGTPLIVQIDKISQKY